MSYLDKISGMKYKEFAKDLLEYMFYKFETASDEDDDICFEMLNWDLNKLDEDLESDINNGYSLAAQMNIFKLLIDRMMIEENEKNKEMDEIFSKLLGKVSKNT